MLNDEDYQRLGLTALQAQVITTLMELGGEAPAPQIIEQLSQHQKVNRTSIYSVLKKLEQLELVVSKEGQRGSNYSLVSTSPSILVDKILQPQQPVVDQFQKQLQAAKDTQKVAIEYELYYLSNREQIINQLELAIQQAGEYLLLMATATTLQDIAPLIKEKEQGDTTILIIPTWNPNPNLSMDDIIQVYRQFLTKSFQICDPMPIFDRIVPMMRSYIKDIPAQVQEITAESYFVMTLTEHDLLMATYMADLTGSGVYTREPTISQMMHIIFLSLFEELTTAPTGIKEITDAIMKVKTKQSMTSIRNALVE